MTNRLEFNLSMYHLLIMGRSLGIAFLDIHEPRQHK